MYPQKIYRLSIYLAGLAILALGITLNTKTGFGVSAVISVPYSLSVILNISIGDMTLIVYSIFALVQTILHLIARKRPSDTPAPSILKIVCMDALTISLLCTGHVIGIGIGTVAAVIGIGRVIAIFNHLTLHTLLKNAGMDASIG